MNLSELIGALPHAHTRGDTTVDVRGIVSDSRRVHGGDLFVAYAGVAVDARKFIPDAVGRGAVAVVTEGDEERFGELIPPNFPFVFVPDAREALAFLASAWNGFPSRKLTVIGVTGTDGKTTTSSLICSILQTAGYDTGLVSTVAAFIGEKAIDTGFHTTTPDALELESYLAQMVAQGAQYAVVESTSLGLAQKRLAAVEYDVAVVTNITHEHLNDHHNSFEEYRAAKRMLFERLLTSVRKQNVPKVAVLNRDDS
ncbi:MAG: Mur ligase domain-containing protein, partial [Chloroflexi bacterium]|nr:Mur ligase domain-containing protein [Chloroflexota bacterium]